MSLVTSFNVVNDPPRVKCRNCELEAIGTSSEEKCCNFWSQFYSRLQEEDVKLDSLTLKQTRFMDETLDDLSGCLTMIPNVKVVNSEMTRKQWAKFAVNINRSDKRLQSLGELWLATGPHCTDV